MCHILFALYIAAQLVSRVIVLCKSYIEEKKQAKKLVTENSVRKSIKHYKQIWIIPKEDVGEVVPRDCFTSPYLTSREKSFNRNNSRI